MDEMDLFDSFGPKTRAAVREAAYPWPVYDVENMRIRLGLKRGRTNPRADESLAATIKEQDAALRNREERRYR